MTVVQYHEEDLADEGSMSMLEYHEDDFGDQLPVGYRFLPTDEVVTRYLINKILCNSIPALVESVFPEIDATVFYSDSPKFAVEFFKGEREWFFFMRNSGELQNKSIRKVGEGVGFWQSVGEKAILDTNRNVIAVKNHLIYFSGGISKAKAKAKKTHWRIDEYRLPNPRNSKVEWVAARLTRGSQQLRS